MQSVNVNHRSPSEAVILGRLLGNEDGELTSAMARYFLRLAFPDADKTRMHDLAVRNQANELSSEEKEEMLAYAKAGTVLSILKSRARRVLRAKVKKRSRS